MQVLGSKGIFRPCGQMCDNCLGIVSSAAPSESNFWNGEGEPTNDAHAKEGADERPTEQDGWIQPAASKRARTCDDTAISGFRTAASIKQSGSSSGSGSRESHRPNEGVCAPFKNPAGDGWGSSSHAGSRGALPPQASAGFSAAARLQQQSKIQARLPPSTHKRADPHIINLI